MMKQKDVLWQYCSHPAPQQCRVLPVHGDVTDMVLGAIWLRHGEEQAKERGGHDSMSQYSQDPPRQQGDL